MAIAPGFDAHMQIVNIAPAGEGPLTTAGQRGHRHPASTYAYVLHARRAPAPVLDLSLLAIPTMRAAIIGGFIYRSGIGAMPFLLPLLLQLGFHLSAFQSGLITLSNVVGAMGMKTVIPIILRRFGFRRALTVNASSCVAVGQYMLSSMAFLNSPAAAGETRFAHRAMRELRTGYEDEREFVEHVDGVLRPAGYRLVGAFAGDQEWAVAVAGFRIGQSLAWGHYLYVDDLSTAREARRRGHAGALLDWLIGEARKLGCGQFHLD